VRFELHSTPVVLGTATVGADGTASATVVIPVGTPVGAHQVVAVATDPFGTTLPAATWNVQVLAAAPAAAPPAGPLATTGADAQDSRFPAAEGMQVGLRGLEARDDRVRVAQEQVAGLGQRHGARAARALDELLADDLLEHLDLLADRRLRVPEPLRGAAEGAFRGDRLQGREMTKLYSEPAIRFHDRYQCYHDLC